MSKQSHTASYFEALLRECESKRHHGTTRWNSRALTMTLSSPQRNHIAGSASTKDETLLAASPIVKRRVQAPPNLGMTL